MQQKNSKPFKNYLGGQELLENTVYVCISYINRLQAYLFNVV